MNESAALRLASYNIQKCVGLDLRRQPRRVLQVLTRLGAQVVVLQEADKRLPPRPAALPHFVLEEAGWEVADLGGAGSLGWHGNAVIWRRGALHLRDMGHIDLPGLEPRGAVWVAFDSPLGPLRVVGLHLGLVGRYRRKQVLHLAQECARLPAMPMIWAGDFNEWSRRSALEGLAPAMRFLPPRASFPALRPLGPLDRIALSVGLGVAGHGVHLEQPAHIASDHLPVWADVVVEG
ncbi:MAG: endonuclease/exonuclease/phosphatase family protein [Antarcticimicrobium sp.]|uniref:endonuclease/exonuclease/phosphatase family protein n=1 Tax=Antarcticimicrobium sp. TaxID=2824147 RepID=UPI00262A8645|nr:endonuclease/exonuclease/phosphatase family protein [Antarcticimicrobium sp.]MDF1717198.1 endonuclease/exonuclease/phosphatase family protein [Antarcticimicrobium sp.]